MSLTVFIPHTQKARKNQTIEYSTHSTHVPGEIKYLECVKAEAPLLGGHRGVIVGAEREVPWSEVIGLTQWRIHRRERL